MNHDDYTFVHSAASDVVAATTLIMHYAQTNQ